jgi:hypothetical protein
MAIFPQFDVLHSPLEGMPLEWARLISTPNREHLERLGAILGLAEQSVARRALASCHDVGMLVPKRQRDKGNRRMWELGLLYDSVHAMLFSFPDSEFLQGCTDVSPQYFHALSTLGAFRFHQDSGRVIWPFVIPKISNNLAAAMGDQQPRSITPFYDHLTGDYDCWLDRDFDTTWHYAHETQRLTRYASGCFGVWIERRFSATLCRDRKDSRE